MKASTAMTKAELVLAIDKGIAATGVTPRTKSTTALRKDELVSRLDWLRAKYKAQRTAQRTSGDKVIDACNTLQAWLVDGNGATDYAAATSPKHMAQMHNLLEDIRVFSQM